MQTETLIALFLFCVALYFAVSRDLMCRYYKSRNVQDHRLCSIHIENAKTHVAQVEHAMRMTENIIEKRIQVAKTSLVIFESLQESHNPKLVEALRNELKFLARDLSFSHQIDFDKVNEQVRDQ